MTRDSNNNNALVKPLVALSRDRNLLRLLVITILIFLTMSLLRPERFFNSYNISSMAFQFPEYGILAFAIMLTMLTGGIDLSIVGIANLSGILVALIVTRLIPPDAAASTVAMYSFFAILVSLLTGMLAGLLNGFFVAHIGIPPILATLGTMQLYTGIAIVITRGSAIFGLPEFFSWMGNGSLAGIPVPFVIFLIVAIAMGIILNRSAFGYKVYLLGTNPTASRFAGINNTAMLMRTYLISGILAAMAGLIVISRTNSAKADYGTSYTLQAILIAVLGGVNPNGGFGTVLGLILAILSLQFLSSGFSMLGFSNFAKEFIWGAVLLLVLAINYLGEQRRSKALVKGQTGGQKPDKAEGQAN